jgi:hypothetical protein
VRGDIFVVGGEEGKEGGREGGREAGRGRTSRRSFFRYVQSLCSVLKASHVPQR